MEFGRVPENELETIDFSLPPDPLFNSNVLIGNPVKNPKVYTGCTKWGGKEWVGKIYPLKIKEKDFLKYYVQHYNSIELNATHYKIYAPEGIIKWANIAAKKDFLFCPKMYKGVTHYGTLKGKDTLTTEFLKGVLAFGKHLGPIFIQVSESFSPNRKEELFTYLESLPKDLQFFAEVRHPHWFADAATVDGLFSKLKEMNIGAVITDTGARRDCAHMHLTVPKVFIRYVGYGLHGTDYKRIGKWADRIKHWLDNGLEEVFFFMHLHNEAFSPELTGCLADKINKACGLTLKKPVFISQQKALFS
ncbi:MAG: DUF72 domain-containing protein [Ferruginibacter sp.]